MKKVMTGMTVVGLAFLVLSVFLGQACATKKMVVEQVAKVDQEVQGVKTSVEENQKRIKEHDAKLADHGNQLNAVGQNVAKQEQGLKDTQSKLDDVRALAVGTLVGEEVLHDDGSKFKFDSAELGDESKKILDAFIQKLAAEKMGFYLEIRGFTDNVGPEEYNVELGRRRAQAVMDYLYKTYNIPLYRLQVYSFGSANPIGDNATSEGRALNRRVEIRAYK